MDIKSTVFEIYLKPKASNRDTIEVVKIAVDGNGFATADPENIYPTGGRTFYELDWNDSIVYFGDVRQTLSVRVLEQNGKKRSWPQTYTQGADDVHSTSLE